MLTSELMFKHFLIMESLPRRIYGFSSIIMVISIMVISMAMDSIPGLPTDVFGWFLDTTLGSPLPKNVKLAVYTRAIFGRGVRAPL